MNSERVHKLESIIGYKFKDKSIFWEALTHRSFAYENSASPDVKDNERLEFLGDAVIGLAVSHFLWHRFPSYTEGELSRLRSAMVNEKELARVAERWNMGDFIRLGKGEKQTGGREKPSILAGAVEALLGAIYLDGGWNAVLDVTERCIIPLLSVFSMDDPIKEIKWDYKTRLQEWMQAQFKKAPVYRLDKEEGPDHEKVFYVSVLLDNEVLGRGRGRSKKEAQQNAAQVAYIKLTEKKTK